MKRIASKFEGVTSFALRIKVNFQLKGDGEASRTASFFVKCTPKYKIQLDVIKATKMFYIEWIFFEKLVPSMLELSSGTVELPLPAFYYTDFEGERGNFYMEDLLEAGYRPPDDSFCLNGFDYAHCSLVVKRLGRFHALTMAAERASPRRWTEMYPELGKDFVFYEQKAGDPPSPIQGMIDNFIPIMKEFSKNLEGLPKEAEASGALDQVIRGFWTTFCKLRATPTQGWSVLSHGDFWENNIMFRYERGDEGVERPVDVKFFDMQMVKCCHPAVDLVYFVCQTTGRSFREKHFGNLIGEYYAALSETLKVLKSEPPLLSLEEFKAEVMGRFLPHGIIGRAFFGPVNMIRDDPAVSFSGENRTEEGLEDFFNSGNNPLVQIRFARDPKYRDKVEEIVREFVDMALPNGLNSTDSSPLLDS
ncbi:uncharacterized protein [Hetaerina americana]|uniref:uncharacterized protein n=1 Tax=Hetaerina americana TaxID=62018 RepID=UPI003A7F37D9